MPLAATPVTYDPEIEELLGSPAAPRAGPAAPPAVVRVPATAGGTPLAMGGGFEGADRFDSSVALWSPPLQSADADVLPDKEIGDARARDMLRNDAYVQGAANLHKDNIVGAQFLLNARPDSRAIFGKYDEVFEDEFQQEIETLFDLYAESPNNWIDASRTNTFTSLVRLAVGVHLAGGEVLATAEWDRRASGEFKTMVQMIDTDRLSTPDKYLNEKDVRAGIRFDRNGAPQTYYIRKEHPHDVRWNWQMPEWSEIAVRKPWGRLQVIHIHEQIRPDQSRGYSDLMSSLKATHIGKKVREINLQRLLTQSIYAASITSDLPSDTVFAQLGGNDLTAEQAQKMITGYAEGYLGAIAQYTSGAKNLAIDGVKIPHLFPGTKLDLLAPPKDNFDVSGFETSLMRYQAAAAGVSYEQLSRDYTKTNYSSFKAAGAETRKFMQSRKKIVADRFASAIYRLLLEEAVNANRLSTFPARKAGLLYTNSVLNLRFEALARCEWIGASQGQVDELKETEAAVLRIESGLSTAEDELARLGKDWRKVYRQLRREQLERERLGLPQPQAKGSNAASNSAAADPQQEQAA